MKKEVIRSSDGKRTVGMYPESLRETTFIYNDKYKEKYEWPEDQHNLISPSRVFNLTEDASGLENWRKRVGEEEAERITEQAKEIGLTMHEYIENSLKKITGISHLNSLPLPNLTNHKYHELGSYLGNLILKEALKDKLTEIWGMESRLYYKDLYKGITDLVGVYEGDPCIIDFKCKRSYRKKEWMVKHFSQLTAYGMAHNKMCGTDIKKGIVFVATQKKEFQKFVIEGREWDKYCLDFTNRIKTILKNEEEEMKLFYLSKNKIINNIQKDFI